MEAVLDASARADAELHLFAAPVVELHPAVRDAYAAEVAEPVDIRTLRSRVADWCSGGGGGKLPPSADTWAEFSRLVGLMFENAIEFNRGDAAFVEAVVRVREPTLAALAAQHDALQAALQELGEDVALRAGAASGRVSASGGGAAADGRVGTE